jgi:phosphatidylglycerophosphate synthase
MFAGTGSYAIETVAPIEPDRRQTRATDVHPSHGGAVRTVQSGPALGFAGVVALLCVLAGTVGLSPLGWTTGLVAGAIIGVALGRGLSRVGADGLGPADQVTLTRAVLACGGAALAAGRTQGAARVVLVALAAVALVLDNLDGRVARSTRTTSELGARFDLEVDAFLILVLSVDVSRTVGVWVLGIGAARYAFVVARWALPWMRGSLPPRYWCKVVAAVQGVALTVAAAHVLPKAATAATLVVALALLAESFGREVWSLWRLRPQSHHPRRRLVDLLLSTLAGVLVWAALIAPDAGTRLSPSTLAQVPVEAVVLLGAALVLPQAARLLVAVLSGLALGVLSLVRVLDVGFHLALGRTFEPLTDWTYLGSAEGLLRQSVGAGHAVAVLTAVTLGVAALLLLLPLALVRLTRLVTARRHTSLRVATVLTVVWTLSGVLQLAAVPSLSIASAGTTGLTVRHVRQFDASLEDGRRFARSAADDPFRAAPPDTLLTALRGKDVLFVFVESYGRVALEGAASAPVRALLDDGTAELRGAGFSGRSAFLTSPTFGGLSWLAHSTLQSGLWVDDQRRYDALMRTDRLTLTQAFGRAGWRTVADVPSNGRPWPEGRSFYHYDKTYGGADVGYAGPSFSYASMPDQYTLAAFQRLELDRTNRRPVMAEIDLVSSHTPWAPLPRLVGWNAIGDGSVFGPMPAQGQSPSVVWRDPAGIRTAYSQSIVYSLGTLVSFLQHTSDPNLVVVALGDHQPATVVSGRDASHDVPITVVARDPAVLDRIGGWGWTPGLRPASTAPVWRMDAFRDRFLTAYSAAPNQ